VPTTAGTGSEAQSYALIADADTHEKMACGDPKAAFQVCLRLGGHCITLRFASRSRGRGNGK